MRIRYENIKNLGLFLIALCLLADGFAFGGRPSVFMRIREYISKEGLIIHVSSMGEFYYKRKRLKTYIDRDGYLIFSISKNGKTVNLKCHRLVALLFIPNPDGKPEVNHKFGNKQDCRAFSLEWATRGENQKHSYKVCGRKTPAQGLPTKDNWLSKPVIMISLDGFFLMAFDSAKEAHEATGICRQSICQSRSPLNKRKTAGGFLWI